MVQRPAVRYSPLVALGLLSLLPLGYARPGDAVLVGATLLVNVAVFLVATWLGRRLAVLLLRPWPGERRLPHFTLRGQLPRLDALDVAILLGVAAGVALTAGAKLRGILDGEAVQGVVGGVTLAAFLVGLGGLFVPVLAVVESGSVHTYAAETGVTRPVKPPRVLGLLGAGLFFGTLGELIGEDQAAYPADPMAAAFATVVIVLPVVLAPAAFALYAYLVRVFPAQVQSVARDLGAVEVEHASALHAPPPPAATAPAPAA